MDTAYAYAFARVNLREKNLRTSQGEGEEEEAGKKDVELLPRSVEHRRSINWNARTVF